MKSKVRFKGKAEIVSLLAIVADDPDDNRRCGALFLRCDGRLFADGIYCCLFCTGTGTVL